MWIFLAEFVLVLAALAFVLVAPRVLRLPWIARANQFVRHLAAKKHLAVFAVFALSLAARIAILPIVPLPTPQNHDEFSNLLAADTFASGRLTNPTHPLWQSFETFHIEHQPTYMSMYPPAAGLLLALGQGTLSTPWVGILLATAGMCASMTWMLQAWLPPYWAFIGGILAILRIGLFSYWANSYWGGALPALAGAVFIGALTRLCKKPSALHAALGAVSIGILANTRMYEGALLVGTAVVSMTLYGRMRNLRLTLNTVVPIVLILASTALAMLYYNRTVYGSALTPPYSINRSTYAAAQIFMWQEPKPVPPFRHAVMRDFFVGLELDRFRSFRTPSGFAARTGLKALVFYIFFVGPLLTIPLLCVRLRDTRMGPLTCIGLLMLPGVLLNAWFAPHYVSPASGIVYALILHSMRRLTTFTVRGTRVGSALTTMLLTISVSMTLIILAATWSRIPLNAAPLSWCGWIYRGSERADLVQWLSRQQGQHLVIVRYQPNHSPSNEFVYNRADIDKADIVWAREMESQSPEALLAYFRDRKVWLYEPDLMPTKLTRLR